MKRKGWQLSKSGLWKKGGIVVLAGCLAWIAAGCGWSTDKQGTTERGNEQSVSAKPEAEQQERSVSEAQGQPGTFRAPLTGLQLQDNNETRPVMVMINNHPSARPQSGLTEADMLFEALAEGEITRIAALFQSSRFAEPIGPVRSIRPYFIEIGKGFDAVQVHAGGSPDAYAKLEAEHIANLDEISNAGPYFWRETFRKMPHNLYTNLGKIREGEQKRNLDRLQWSVPAFSFSSTRDEAVETMAAGNKDTADYLEVTFLLSSYVVSYKYDAEHQVYKRFVNGSSHTDLNNGKQLTAANVVIMGTDHQVLDDEGRRDVRVTGTGPALFFQRGKVKKAEWKREKENDPIRYYDQGRELSFQPGQTHVMIVPLKPSFENHVKYGAGITSSSNPAQ